MILDVVQYLNQSGFTVQPPGRGNGLTPRENYIYIKNTSGIIIPAWGCVQATGTTESGNQNYVEVDQPADVDGTAGGYLFNSFAPVEIDGFGIAFDGPLVRVLGNGTTATAGAKWTPVIDSFSIAPSAAGILTMIGNDDIETNVVKVFTAIGGGGGRVVHARTKSGGIPARSVATMGSANCDIWTSSSAGVLSDSNTDATIYNMAASAVAGTTQILASRNAAGLLVVIVEDCA